MTGDAYCKAENKAEFLQPHSSMTHKKNAPIARYINRHGTDVPRVHAFPELLWIEWLLDVLPVGEHRLAQMLSRNNHKNHLLCGSEPRLFY